MALTPLKMNLDYEAQLSTGQSSEKINHALEYLAFYLSSGPFATTASYSEEFLGLVHTMSGESPIFSREKVYENMWGPGANIDVEKELNSKILSARLTQLIAPQEEIRILHSPEDLHQNLEFPLVSKYPHAMSGKGVKKILSKTDLENLTFPCVLEPLRNRVYDFSQFISPEGEMVTYENLVDKNFQYKGTIFHRMNQPGFWSIPWSQSFTNDLTERFEEELSLYRKEFEKLIPKKQKSFGYSLDSFVYEEAGRLKIRTCSEFNFRRTMGWLCYELGKKLAPNASWVALRLFINKKNLTEFRSKNILPLSPPEAKIQVFLLQAQNGKEGQEILAHADRFDVHKFSDSKV